MVISAYAYLQFMPGKSVADSLIITNFLVVLISTLLVFSNTQKPFSLFKMVILFYLIFFGLSPLLEYKLGLSYWGGNPISDNSYLVANFWVLVSLLFYVGCYILFHRQGSINTQRNSILIGAFELPLLSPQKKLTYILLGISVASFVAIAAYFQFDFNSLMYRGGDFDSQVASDNKTLNLVVGKYLRPLLFDCFAIYILMRRRFDVYALLLFSLAIAGASPSALPRFATATLYMSIILMMVWRTRAKGSHLNNLVLFGFVFIFPLLDLFRAFRGWEGVGFRLNFEFLSAGHFDAYQLFVRALDVDVVTYGYQLIGSVLFFVPRSIWADKPWGSGQMLADTIGLYFSNISMPLIGEGYINFGWVGILLFVLILALVTARIDKVFWSISSVAVNTAFPLAYMQMVGLIFFVMRGDLQNGIAYTCGVLAALVTLSYLLRRMSAKGLLR